jgi:hypothetical protein
VVNLKIVNFKDQELFTCKEDKNLLVIFKMDMPVDKVLSIKRMGKLKLVFGRTISLIVTTNKE